MESVIAQQTVGPNVPHPAGTVFLSDDGGVGNGSMIGVSDGEKCVLFPERIPILKRSEETNNGR